MTSVSIPWKFVMNAESQALGEIHSIIICILITSPGDQHIHRSLRRPALPCQTRQLGYIFENYCEALLLPPSNLHMKPCWRHWEVALCKQDTVSSVWQIFQSNEHAGPGSSRWHREPSPFMVISPKYVLHQRSKGRVCKVLDLSLCTHCVWCIHHELSSCQYKLWQPQKKTSHIYDWVEICTPLTSFFLCTWGILPRSGTLEQSLSLALFLPLLLYFYLHLYLCLTLHLYSYPCIHRHLHLSLYLVTLPFSKTVSKVVHSKSTG